MTTQAKSSRRRFLCTAAVCATGSQLYGCSAGAEPAAIGQVDAGLVDDYSVGSLRALGSLPVALGRDEQGFYAMTLTCTHMGCNMAQSGSVSSKRIYCACHGAQFDSNGDVLRGPAAVPLAHFAVSIDPATSEIVVDGDTEVSPDTRTPG